MIIKYKLMQASKINTSNKGILANRYKIISEIGSGLSSHVFKVFDEKTKKVKVAKIYEDNYSSLFLKETQILKILQKLNLSSNIKYFESSIDDLIQNGNITKKIYIILEFGSKGCLYDALNNTQNGFSEEVCKYILLNILNCVDVLHKEGICHRDLKLQNIVLSGNNYDIKLIDFGFAAKYITKENKQKKLKNPVGTIRYWAPEIIEGKPYDGVKTDIFSIGVILFSLMTKKYGFFKADDKDLLYEKIKNKQYEEYWDLLENSHDIKNLSPQFKNLFLKMVSYNPEERPTIEEIKRDEFLSDIINGNKKRINLLRKKMINEIKSSQK